MNKDKITRADIALLIVTIALLLFFVWTRTTSSPPPQSGNPMWGGSFELKGPPRPVGKRLPCDTWFQGVRDDWGYLVRFRKIDGDREGYYFTVKTTITFCGLPPGLYEVGVKTVRRSDCCPSSEVVDTATVHGSHEDRRPMDCPPLTVLDPTPNPASHHIVFSWDLDTTRLVSIAIYGVAGERVANVPMRFYPPGISRMEFDLRELPTGVYFVQIHGVGITGARKFVVVH